MTRACENMLQNSEYAKEALRKLSDETKRTFIDKVKDFYKKIVAAIKDILGRADSNSKEYRMLSRNISELEKAQKLWDEVIKESSENTLKRDAEIANGSKIFGDSNKLTHSKKTVNYSLKDSDGNALSKGQQDYFKNSKIRDTKGNLKVMYHGTNASFTVFNPFASGGKNGFAEGYGLYFTDSSEIADSYGQKCTYRICQCYKACYKCRANN